MADVAGINTCHATLSTTTADTVTLSGDNIRAVEVLNRSGSTTIYFTVNGATAVAEADETYAVPAGQALVVPLAVGDGYVASANTVLSVVGNGNAYSVHALL
jgi:hypothetical protein